MLSKSTRAFRTISEAGDELDLQPHVLRFWESKFSQIQPMKRSGGRRFYRPEDIEFLRGIKILLHREKHPIKDVQKLIRVRGAQSVVELGRAKAQASRPKDIKDTDLVPQRIKSVVEKPVKIVSPVRPFSVPVPVPETIVETIVEAVPIVSAAPETPSVPVESVLVEPDVNEAQASISAADKEKMQIALARLQALKSRWGKFK